MRASGALGKRVGALVAKGVPPATAAVRCGLGRATHFRYLRDAEAIRELHPNGDYPEASRPVVAYAEAVEAGLAEFEERLVGVLVEGVPDDPRLALQVLARRFPADWREQRSGGAAPVRADASTDDGAKTPATIHRILQAAPGGTPPRAA